MTVIVILGSHVRKPKSALAQLGGWVTNLAVVAAISWTAWYAYSHFEPASSDRSDSDQGATFNCKRALAERESDYACVESDSCTMTSDELAELKSLEAEINEHCNLPFSPLPDVVL